MMRRSAAILLFTAAIALTARAGEAGLPVLRIIPQSEHHGGPQSFDAAQDGRGILYFGNLKGVLAYDGAWWRVTTLPNDSAVFAIESDAAGIVAVGAIGELGYLTAGANGAPAYRSLLPQLPEAQRDVGEVRGLCTSGRGFVFTSERYVIEWNGGAPRVLATFPPDSAPARCARIGGSVVVWNHDGLYRLEGGHLVDAGLQGQSVDAAVEIAGGNTLAAVHGEGLFIVDPTGITWQPDAESSARVAAVTVTNATRLRDGSIALTTRENGLLLLNENGALRDVLDQKAGLPDSVLSSALVDAEGALWLTYYGPLVRVDLASPLTVLDARRGVLGSPAGMLFDRGRRWIMTSHGVFALDDDRPAGTGAVRVEGIPAPAWNAIAIDDGVMIAASAGVFVVKDNAAPARIAGTEDLIVYDLVRPARDPSRIWLCTRKGLARLQRDGNTWRFDGMVTGSPTYTRSLMQLDGVVWAGTIFHGVLRVDDRDKFTQFGDGELYPYAVGGRLVVVRSSGRIMHIDETGQLIPDPLLGDITTPNGFFSIAEDAQRNVWLNSDPVRIVKRGRDGRYARDAQPLAAVGTAVASILRDTDGAMWFAAQEGLFRYAPRPPAPQPLPVIHTAAGSAPLPHDFGRLRIEFAPLTYGPGVMYQYRLDPIDSAWSDWTAEPFIDYTRLGGGQYTFRLRARGGSGAMSDESQWSFTVMPPWYFGALPITIAVLLAAALVALIVKLRTRALRRQADRLRALVAERTQELSEANQHLERLALLDELTGIPNRRYFDRALARAWESAREHHRPLSLVILDIDHFKLVNDEHGHAAGDASLVYLGRLLAQKIRRSGEWSRSGEYAHRSGEFTNRSGDVVARVGGEEFAIILAANDLAEAARRAENLRAAIEELEIVFDAVHIRVSASCGVATMVPGDNDSADQLYRRADAALYMAKAAGRNRVQVADFAPPVRRISGGAR